MNLQEYNNIKNLNYRQYCKYLQNKYGKPPRPYMTNNFVKGGSNRKLNSRTKEGLMIHHKYEDTAIMLGSEEFAKRHPHEWQQPENLVYCDYVEHYYLHYLILKYPKSKKEDVGVGGLAMIKIELIDYYSNQYSKYEPWRINCFERVKNDKDVFIIVNNLATELYKRTHC